MRMTGLTIDEMCEALNLPFKTVEARIQRAGIKPVTRQALYPADTLGKIKDIKMGRPKKTIEPLKPATKSKKTKK
jgi:hypothetical protein